MKIVRLSLSLTALIFLSVFAVTNARAQGGGTLFTVNHNGDTLDVSVGDGVCADSSGNCTLRAAIQEANASLSQDAINFALPTPATIDLTLGELEINSLLYIVGPGARKLTVQRSATAGTPQFRIFRIQSAGAALPPIVIRGLTIRNGSTTSDGGAFFINYGAFIQLTEVAITNNIAASGGVFNAGTLHMTRSLVNSNTATGLFGAGITNIDSATAVISNSTLTNNTGNQGGAIYNAGNLLLVNDTISHNLAGNGGSSIFNHTKATVNVLNTIIGMDISSPSSSLSGAFTSLGNNLVTDARNSTGFTNGVKNDQVSDNNTYNPLIGNLTDNGGQTDTRALLEGSPAINQGNNCVFNTGCEPPVPQGFRLAYDQRQNYWRSTGSAVDIGAFESGANVFSSNGSLGAFGFRNRMGGILLILTKAGTNEKQYRVTNQFGGFTFDNIVDRDVYFIERKGKRAGTSGLLIFDLDNLPILLPGVSKPEQDAIEYRTGK